MMVNRSGSVSYTHLYVADQLRELVSLLEDATHRSLDPEALRVTMMNSRRTIQAYQRSLALRGKVSLDTTMTSELCAMISTHIMLGRPEALRFMEDVLAVTERARGTERSDKVRLFWIHTPVYYTHLCYLLNSSRTLLQRTSLSCSRR